MEDNPSKKKYRGFKYMVLALLVFTAIGFFYFSKDGQQMDDPQAKVKEAASSLAADAKQQGKNLMEKAGEIKTGVSDKLAQGREKVSTMASGAGDKAGEMVQAASDSGAEMVDRVKSATNAGTDWADRATSAADSGKDWADRAKSAADMADDTDMGRTTQSDQLSEQASQAFTREAPKAKSMMDASSPSMTDTDTPEASAGNMNPQMATDADEVVDTMKKRMTAEASDDKMTGMDAVSSDKREAMRSSAEASTEIRKTGSDAIADKSGASASAVRCIGSPPKGKDLGTKYIVASCETLSIISERTGVGFSDLKEYNPQVQNPDLIYPNQELRLPPRG